MPKVRQPPRQVIVAELVEEPETTALAVRQDLTLTQWLPANEDALFALVMLTLSPNTRKAYTQDIKAFGTWWGTPDPISKLIAFKKPGPARTAVLQYQSYLKTHRRSKEHDPVSPATIARRIRALNSIIEKLNFAGFVDWKLDVPVAKIEALKDVRGPGMAKWKQLLRSVEQDESWLGVRDLAILLLMGKDNLRAGEIGLLRRHEDIRIGENGRMEIFIHGKGGKNVWHPLHPQSHEALTAWLEVRDDRLEEKNAKVKWLFFSQRNGPLGGKRVWERVVKRAKDAGIGDLHPHALRHHAITHQAKNWKGTQSALVVWARHSDANTTQRYIDEVRDEVYQISQLGEYD